MSVHIEGLDEIEKIINETIKTVKKNVDKTAQTSANNAKDQAQTEFADAEYPGTNDVEVKVEPDTSESGVKRYDVIAKGEAVLFIEFGTGVRYSPEHPLAGEFGMARGGYGKGQGANPKGWLYPESKGGVGTSDAQESTVKAGMLHTYGNPAAMAMYNAGNTMEKEIDKGLEHLLL